MTGLFRVQDIRAILSNQLWANPDIEMLEIIGCNFIADEESIFGTVNYEYVANEIAWYESMSRNVNDLQPTPKIWKDVADQYGIINSNYGWCVYSEANGNQYDYVFNELVKNPNSRRGTMIYNRPSMHQDATLGGMNDFMCTNAVNYFIRDGALHAVVQMRSNDAIFGYKNDYAWQKYVQVKLAEDLGVLTGLIYWNAASLHIYPRHYHLVTGEEKC